MKRFSYSVCAVFMAAALLLSCNKKIDSPSVTAIKGLTITALHDASSRTTFDGEKSKWSDGDKMNVLISASDDSSIGPNEFEITDAENAKFSNSDVVTNAGETYKFYAVYPVCDISADKCATIHVGAAAQEQVGMSANHIAALDPLYGYNESPPEAVSIQMKHTAVVMKLDIKNLTGNANLVVKKVKVKAPTGTAIAGGCNLNIESGAISPSNEGSNVIELDVKDASAIAEDGIFTAWVAAAPFTIARGGSLLFTVVDGDDNEYDVIKSFPDGRDFISGKILSATLEISEIATTTITASFNFTDESIYPANVPTEEGNVVNNITCKSGEYIVDIFAANGCYYSNTTDGGKLNIQSINTQTDASQYAKLTLPQIAGYKITGINLGNAAEDAVINNNVFVVLCYKKAEVETACIEKKFVKSASFSSDNLKDYICDDSPFYLKIVTEKNKTILVKSLDITYSRM